MTNVLAAVRLLLAAIAVIDGIWLVSLGIIWLNAGVSPATLGPSTLLGAGAILLALGIDVALRAKQAVDRDPADGGR